MIDLPTKYGLYNEKSGSLYIKLLITSILFKPLESAIC